MRIKIKRGYVTIIGVYTPEDGRKEETEKFYSTLQKEVNKHIKTDHLIIAGDLNARVGNILVPKVIGTYKEHTLNENGQILRTFVNYNKLKISNGFLRKKDINKYIWSARGSKSIINYVMVNEKLAALVENIYVYRVHDIYSDHYLALSKIRLLERWRSFKKK